MSFFDELNDSVSRMQNLQAAQAAQARQHREAEEERIAQSVQQKTAEIMRYVKQNLLVLVRSGRVSLEYAYVEIHLLTLGAQAALIPPQAGRWCLQTQEEMQAMTARLEKASAREGLRYDMAVAIIFTGDTDTLCTDAKLRFKADLSKQFSQPQADDCEAGCMDVSNEPI